MNTDGNNRARRVAAYFRIFARTAPQGRALPAVPGASAAATWRSRTPRLGFRRNARRHHAMPAGLSHSDTAVAVVLRSRVRTMAAVFTWSRYCRNVAPITRGVRTVRHVPLRPTMAASMRPTGHIAPCPGVAHIDRSDLTLPSHCHANPRRVCVLRDEVRPEAATILPRKCHNVWARAQSSRCCTAAAPRPWHRCFVCAI